MNNARILFTCVLWVSFFSCVNNNNPNRVSADDLIEIEDSENYTEIEPLSYKNKVNKIVAKEQSSLDLHSGVDYSSKESLPMGLEDVSSLCFPYDEKSVLDGKCRFQASVKLEKTYLTDFEIDNFSLTKNNCLIVKGDIISTDVILPMKNINSLKIRCLKRFTTLPASAKYSITITDSKQRVLLKIPKDQNSKNEYEKIPSISSNKEFYVEKTINLNKFKTISEDESNDTQTHSASN